ncbi:MAG: hypothetical protein ACETV1_07765 [Candidatus Bathyarchaeia archaeon]
MTKKKDRRIDPSTDRLTWKDYFALVVAMLTTSLLPFMMILLILIGIVIVISL